MEINCHGGYFAAGLILNELLSCGARLAEPGEFTRRAFINGKTDMTGAEAAMGYYRFNLRFGSRQCRQRAELRASLK